MIATAWPPMSQTYIPQRPSPLSPRSANAMFRPIFSSMSKSDQLARQETPFSKRVVRPNPLLKGRDEQRERRRDLFMKKVEQGRDDKRWEGRSDQILRSDYMTQQRKWEEEQFQSAPELFHEFEEEESEETGFLPNQRQTDCAFGYHTTPLPQPHRPASFDEAEVDAVARMEEQELQVLIALEQEDNHAAENLQIPSSPTRYGSDEEEYDDLFMEFLSSHGAQPREEKKQEEDSMDLSNG